MGAASDWTEMIAQLEREARAAGSFVDRAIVRELKIASSRFAGQESVCVQVAALIESWRGGMSDLQVLEAVRRINRIATCWKDAAVSATETTGTA